MMRWLTAICLVSLVTPAAAESGLPPAPYADTQLADPRQEAAATALMQSLRCLVCQGQSIADSQAEMAGDMRALVRTRIAEGDTPDAIRGWLIARYGDRVSYQPPVSPMTWPLWVAPLLFLAAGAWIARERFRRRG